MASRRIERHVAQADVVVERLGDRMTAVIIVIDERNRIQDLRTRRRHVHRLAELFSQFRVFAFDRRLPELETRQLGHELEFFRFQRRAGYHFALQNVFRFLQDVFFVVENFFQVVDFIRLSLKLFGEQ